MADVSLRHCVQKYFGLKRINKSTNIGKNRFLLDKGISRRTFGTSNSYIREEFET